MADKDPKWKQIAGFPQYYISDRGQVINLALRKILTPHARKRDHPYVRLISDGVVFTVPISKLMRRYHGVARNHRVPELRDQSSGNGTREEKSA